MPSISLKESEKSYLEKCITESDVDSVVSGIIIGQNLIAGEYTVAHLAKNREDDIDARWPMETISKGSETEQTPQVVRNFDDINTQYLANQWLSAIRMIPGSFSVLGIFVGARDSNILGESTLEMTRKVLNEIHDILMQSTIFADNEMEIENDYLSLAYSLDAKTAVCMAFPQPDNQSGFKPIQCQFSNKSFQWHTVNCQFELNETFPIVDLNLNGKMTQQVYYEAIKMARHLIKASEILIQNNRVDEEMTIEKYVKDRFAGDARTRNFQATIFIALNWPCHRKPKMARVRLFGGTVRFLGTISSRIYCSPHNTFKDVKQYVRSDIIRSLAARIQNYCDDLADENTTSEGILISYPPRRIYFNLSKSDQKCPIQFSEYIHLNETTAMAISQVHQVLDLQIKVEDVIDDFKSIAIDESFRSMKPNRNFTQSAISMTQRITRSMYVFGIMISFLLLLISVCLSHFFQN